jgi:hypothetical protein
MTRPRLMLAVTRADDVKRWHNERTAFLYKKVFELRRGAEETRGDGR